MYMDEVIPSRVMKPEGRHECDEVGVQCNTPRGAEISARRCRQSEARKRIGSASAPLRVYGQ